MLSRLLVLLNVLLLELERAFQLEKILQHLSEFHFALFDLFFQLLGAFGMLTLLFSESPGLSC